MRWDAVALALGFVVASTGLHGLPAAWWKRGRTQPLDSDAQGVQDDLRDRFLGTVSHELRTPLNAIIGWTQLLKDGLLEPKERRRAIEAIDRNAQMQARLVNELLDLSRLRQGRVKVVRAPVDLSALLEEVVEAHRAAAAAKHVQLTYEPQATAITVLGDAAKLRQVLQHLLSNAVKFTPSAGHVEVTMQRSRAWVLIDVADDGIGIDPSELPRIFEPFYQSPSAPLRSGLGVGLPLAHELIALHGGTLTAQSDGLGRGSRFTVRLPATRGLRRWRTFR